MPKVIRTSVGGNNYNTGLLWQAFFDTLDCPLISVTSTAANVYINVEDNVTFRIETNSHSGARSNYCYLVHAGLDFSTGFANRPMQLTIGYSDTFLYMQGQRAVTADNTNRWCVIYEKFNDFTVYGYSSTSTTSKPFITLDSSSFIVKPLGDTANRYDAQYEYRSKLDTTASVDVIHYTNGALLASGIAKVEDTSNYISCSKVETNKMITINNKKYYSAASSILIPIDN